MELLVSMVHLPPRELLIFGSGLSDMPCLYHTGVFLYVSMELFSGDINSHSF
jgi:hypothetical protein